MQNDKILFVINDAARAVKLNYDPLEVRASGEVSTSLGKTLDHTLEVGDFVVVESDTRHGITVAKIVEVDVDVDVESSTPIRWIFQKIDNEQREGVLAAEAEAQRQVREVELRRKRERLRKAMFDDDANVKKLELAQAPKP